MKERHSPLLNTLLSTTMLPVPLAVLLSSSSSVVVSKGNGRIARLSGRAFACPRNIARSELATMYSSCGVQRRGAFTLRHGRADGSSSIRDCYRDGS